MAYNRSPQNANNFVIFDFETGGVDSNLNPVTEIAIITIDGGTLKEIDRYQALIAPYDDKLFYDPKAEKVSGISRELVESEGLPIEQVAKEVYDIISRANIRQEKSAGLLPVLVGHNVKFDINMLCHLFQYGLGQDFQKLMQKVLHGNIDHFGNFQPSYIDTWSVGKPWFQEEGELYDYKLATLAEKLGVDLNNAHRAMNDVITTTEIIRRYLTNLRSSFKANYTGEREGFRFPI